MTSEERNYLAAEKELARLERETGRRCKIVHAGAGVYGAVVVGSVGHHDALGSMPCKAGLRDIPQEFESGVMLLS